MSTILVTGGTRGIGAACVRRFAMAGDRVFAVGRHEPDIEPSTGDVIFIECDLTAADGCRKLYEAVPVADVLINNAGLLPGCRFDDYPEELRDAVIRLNMIVPAELSVHYGKLMAERGGGRIVSISSHAARCGHPDIWYGMSKAAVVNMTASCAALLGAKGVIVNAVAPGPVATEMALGQADQSRYRVITEKTNTKRMAEPEEIADVVFWLAKESPVYLNGETITVNDGAFSRNTGIS